VAPLSPPIASDSPANAPTVALSADLPFPPAAPEAALYPWDEMTGAYTLLPATARIDTGGEPPYPDLRTLPTRAMAFEPVVFGDVAGIRVTPAG
jgi:hypothetical protein